MEYSISCLPSVPGASSLRIGTRERTLTLRIFQVLLEIPTELCFKSNKQLYKSNGYEWNFLFLLFFSTVSYPFGVCTSSLKKSTGGGSLYYGKMQPLLNLSAGFESRSGLSNLVVCTMTYLLCMFTYSYIRTYINKRSIEKNFCCLLDWSLLEMLQISTCSIYVFSASYRRLHYIRTYAYRTCFKYVNYNGFKLLTRKSKAIIFYEHWLRDCQPPSSHLSASLRRVNIHSTYVN